MKQTYRKPKTRVNELSSATAMLAASATITITPTVQTEVQWSKQARWDMVE